MRMSLRLELRTAPTVVTRWPFQRRSRSRRQWSSRRSQLRRLNWWKASWPRHPERAGPLAREGWAALWADCLQRRQPLRRSKPRDAGDEASRRHCWELFLRSDRCVGCQHADPNCSATAPILCVENVHLGTEGFDDELCDFGSGVLLLAGDQASVADGEGLEAAGLDVVGAAFFGGVLDVPGHQLVADIVVGELLLDIGEAGHRLARDQVGAVGEGYVDQRGGAVAERARHLLGLVEGAERVLELRVVAEGEHRRLAADDDQRVVV